ncbi:major facilitator superfamily domain-containing protein [Mycena haematopus]|nr:major facilitator superfamily domain-containing protein [Mycena haematopus]
MDVSDSSPPPKRSSWRGVVIAGTCTAAMIVNSSNNTSVAIALPTIGAALHARSASLQWLVSAYPLSSGCLLLFCGHLADTHGRKRVFVGGSALLFAFTLACTFVHDDVTLAVLRGFQGIGGAATIPAALGILAHEFPPSSGRARAAAFSSFSAGAPLGGALGMVLGGLVTQLSKYTWRAQFILSAAIALATLLVGIFVIPPDPPLRSMASSLPPAAPAPSTSSPSPSSAVPHTYPPESKPAQESDVVQPQRDTRTDWPGAILSAAGLILLVFVLGQGSGPGLPPPRMGMGMGMNMSFIAVDSPTPSPVAEVGNLFPRGFLPEPNPHVAASLEDEDQGHFELDYAHQHPEMKPHLHERRHPHPPPPPPGGFLRWFFGRRPPPPPHPHYGPPHRRSTAEPTPWRVQSESDYSLELDGADLEGEEGIAVGHSPHPHDHHQEHGPHHHHGPDAHDGHHAHHGPHPHHGSHPHHDSPPYRHGLGAIIDWLVGRHPPHRHRHGPRAPPGGGPPGSGSGGRPPPPPHGGQAWGMAYIVSLLVLSLVLLTLFALWELHLERVHSRIPGSALYEPTRHPSSYHGQDTPDATVQADDPRRSSASSASAPSLPVAGPSPRVRAPGNKPPTRTSPRFLPRAVTNNRYVEAALAYAPPPLLPPSLFARRRGRLGVIYGIALLQFGAFMIWAFWVQLYYQIYIGYSPVRTVVRLTPMFVTGIICNVAVALLVGRVPTLWLLATGTLTTTVAPLLFALIVPSAPYWAFGFPAAVCSVVGADFLFASGTMFVADSVGPGEQSVAGGVFQTMTQLGTSLGVTASTILFNHVQQQNAFPGGDTLKSYHAAMWMGVGFGGVATLFALAAFRGVGTPGRPESPPDGPEKAQA